MADCSLLRCNKTIIEPVQFPFCPFHYHQKVSINNNRCLIKLCEYPRLEAFSFCDKHCDEFFEKEESELKRTIGELGKDLVDARKANSELYNKNRILEEELKATEENLDHFKNLVQRAKKSHNQMSKRADIKKPSLTREILKNEGVVMCTVDTMKKILNGVV